MLSFVTGKTGLAVLALCVGLTVVWAVRDPVRAGDGRNEIVINTALEMPNVANHSPLAILDQAAVEAKTEEMKKPPADNADEADSSNNQTTLEPTDPIPMNRVERHIINELKSTRRRKIEYSGVPLEVALQNLGHQHRIDVVIEEQVIDEARLSVDEKIDLFLDQGISLGSAIELMLDPAGLAYYVEDEVLKITARDALSKRVATRAYYIPEISDSQSSKDLAERLGGLLTAGRRYRLFRKPEPDKHSIDRQPVKPAPTAPRPVIEIFGDRLLMSGTFEDHKNLQGILRLIYMDLKPSSSGNEEPMK